jgi:hypothetical protein
MSAIVNKLAKTLKENDFSLEDKVEIIGMKTEETSNKKIETFCEKQFNLSDVEGMDVYFAKFSPLCIIFTTKEGEKLRYARDRYEPNKKWNLINPVVSGISYCFENRHSNVRNIYINILF